MPGQLPCQPSCPERGDRKVRTAAAPSEATFGAGVGIVGFYLDEDARQIRIFDIVWVG